MSELPIDDATTAYYKSMARNMVPAVFDLFHFFCKSNNNLNPFRAYMVGKFKSDNEDEVRKPENQILQLKHMDDKQAVMSLDDAMSAEQVAHNLEEYKFVGSILPLFISSINDEAKHLSQPLTEMYLLVTLIKPTQGESYLRIQIKCYKRPDWNKIVLDGKL